MGRRITPAHFRSVVMTDGVPYLLMLESPLARLVQFCGDDSTRTVNIAAKESDLYRADNARIPALVDHRIELAAGQKLWAMTTDGKGTILSFEWWYIDDGSGSPLPAGEE